MKFLKSTILAFTVFSLASCKDDKKIDPVTPDPATTNKVTMQFDNYVGSEPLELNRTAYYKNENGDDFSVVTYDYYITNIVLKGDNGTTFVEPESYHFISQRNTNTLSFVIDKVPFGNYTSVQVMIGVDSTRNVSGAQTGDLDPALGMFWTWNSGYIMAKFEGKSPQAPGSNILTYHITGFSGAYSAIRVVELPLGSTMSVKEGSTNKITVKSDLLAWFKNPTLINFATTSSVSSVGPISTLIADNYAHMLSVTSVQ